MTTQELKLTAKFHNGQSYVFYGTTKSECWSNFKKKFGSKSGFVKFDFTIED